MERAALMCTADELRPDHLPSRIVTGRVSSPNLPSSALSGQPSSPAAAPPPDAHVGPREERRAAVEEVERRQIEEALAKCGGNQTQAAAMLGISRRTLVSRLSQYDFPRPRKKP
jgi:DNA-binding NtrC family response regulator